MIKATDILKSIDTTGRLAWPAQLPLQPKSNPEIAQWRAKGVAELMGQYKKLHPHYLAADTLLYSTPKPDSFLGVVYSARDGLRLEILESSDEILLKCQSEALGYEGLSAPLLINREVEQMGCKTGDLLLVQLIHYTPIYGIVNVEVNFGQIR